MTGSNNDNNYPRPGNVYKLTGMLKEWLDRLSADSNEAEYVNLILNTINNYSEQLNNAGKQNKNLAAKAAHDAIDKLFTSAAEEDKKGIQCSKGCAACCYIDATIAESEAKLIIDHCEKNNFPIDKSYLKKQAARGRKEFSEISKCVFLENNLCSIYEVRPATCRKHFVKNDPALCDSSKNKDIPLITYFNLQSEIIASALLNTGESGPIEKMLLDQLNLNKDQY